jgi:uncharacterized protein (DUF3084 family)
MKSRKEIESREQRAESREQRAESREQRAESREQRPECREQSAESREQRSESSDQSAESRVQRAESREQRAESREQRAKCREQRAESREQRIDVHGLQLLKAADVRSHSESRRHTHTLQDLPLRLCDERAVGAVTVRASRVCLQVEADDSKATVHAVVVVTILPVPHTLQEKRICERQQLQ